MICVPLVSKGGLCQQSEEVHQTLLTVRGDADEEFMPLLHNKRVESWTHKISTMTLWTLASMESASGRTYVAIRAAVPNYKTITSFMMDEKKKKNTALLAVNWEEENVVWD